MFNLQRIDSTELRGALNNTMKDGKFVVEGLVMNTIGCRQLNIFFLNLLSVSKLELKTSRQKTAQYVPPP